MPVKHDFLGYIGKDLHLKPNVWTVVPNTKYVPANVGILTPNVYINAKYEISATAKRDGMLWVRLMRENPSDSTMNYDLILPRGYGTILDSRSFEKWWGKDEIGRGVHLEVKVTGVTSAYLNDTCYVSFSQIW